MKKAKTPVIIVLLILLLAVSAGLHGFRMFEYPYYESDEGTYMSQAWSLIETGDLTPYTYWYDHPPLGWIAIAAWIKLLGDDFFRFGTSVDTGRVFMLLVHLASVSLVYYTVLRVTKNPIASFLGGLLFTVSPLGIYFQRRVLLDNVMILWILSSTAVLFAERIRLRHYLWSGLFFAFAVLTKVTAVMFGPSLLLLAILQKNDIPKVFRGTLWLAVSMFATSSYILYAMMRGEFLPARDGDEHVSLIESTLFQMSRDGGGVPFWDPSSHFYMAVLDWMNKDTMTILVGAGILVLSLVFSIWSRRIRFFALASFLYLFFLIRGGIVINFYILPLLPFVAMAGAILCHDIASFFSKREGIRAMLLAFPIAAVVAYYALLGPMKHFERDETSQQRAAIEWVKTHLPEESAIIVDSYALVDVRDPRSVNEKTFPNADWYYKVNRDPEIRDVKFRGDWRSFDYIMLTHEMLKQIRDDAHPIAKEAYRNALPIAKWLGHPNTFVDERNFLTTNGDWAMVFRVNDEHYARLLDSWEQYKQTYMILQGENYGQVIDPDTGVTTSEGQSYAMLRAAWMNDQYAFVAAWLWTRNHLQHRLDDQLFSWKWQDGAVVDSANATDADEDIALALIFAHRLWDEPEYLAAAQEILDDLWEHSVVKLNGRYHLLPMHEESADKWSGYLFNPSYLSPASYRVFAAVDPKHDWEALADDSYEILEIVGEQAGNDSGLPADWLYLDKKYGGFYSAASYFDRPVDDFSYDAFRVFFRIALDRAWFDTPEAQEYLSKRGEYLAGQYETYGRIPATLSLDEPPTDGNRSLSVDTGYAVALSSFDPAIGERFFAEFVDAAYDEEALAWGGRPNYYDANWAWFGTGAFRDILPNLWELNMFNE